MHRQLLKTLSAFLLVLLLMPLGHALMILMEHFLAPTTLHYCAFLMGFSGLVLTIIGIYVKGDTKQTMYGIIGAMFFWTGWVEFLFVYYAQRYGVHCDLLGSGVVQSVTHYVDGIGVNQEYLINGQPLETFSRQELKAIRGSRPEYLIMPATFGLWMMIMTSYIFNSRTGCNFINWIQRRIGIRQLAQNRMATPVSATVHSSSLTVFMEWNIMMWGSYLLLMFCYDPIFLGSSHPVTIGVGIVSLIASILMLKKQMKIKTWGRQIRFALATVIIFWTFVEVMGRNNFFNEVWTDPVNHVAETVTILTIFVGVIVFLYLCRRKCN